jgi:leucine dehydrogenase
MRDEGDFEQVIALHDRSCGLSGFMVIHDTSRGPAAGGIRLYHYRDEDEALTDGFRLARAMTFKAAAAELPVGGGKIVLVDSPALVRDEVLRAVGRAIDGLSGRFLAGRDVGVSIASGALVRSETRFMVDESAAGVEDLNRATALGVEAGARAALAFATGRSDWAGVRVAIQGAGGVGSWLARILGAFGAELMVSDPDRGALSDLRQDVGFREVAPGEILEADCDVLAPCAIGGILDAAAAGRLRAKVVAGSANNVLASAQAGEALFARGIVYAPDFLVNAGALIQGVRFLLTGERASPSAIAAIGGKTATLLARAREEAVPAEVLLERETALRLSGERGWRRWFRPSPG